METDPIPALIPSELQASAQWAARLSVPHGPGAPRLPLGFNDLSNFPGRPPPPCLGTACPAYGVRRSTPPLSFQVGSAPVYSGVVLSRRQTDPRLRRGSAVPLGAPSASASAPSASSASSASAGTRDLGVCPTPDPARDMSTPARRRLMRDFKR